MAGLPDSLSEIVGSPAAACCKIKNCKSCEPRKMHPVDAKIIASCIPPPVGKSKYETTWEHERVKKNLQKDLENLGPRFWHTDIFRDLKLATRTHDWYS